MAPKRESITLNVVGAAHAFEYRAQTTEKVPETVNLVAWKSFEAKTADEIANLARQGVRARSRVNPMPR